MNYHETFGRWCLLGKKQSIRSWVTPIQECVFRVAVGEASKGNPNQYA